MALSSLAEELAAWVIIREAKRYLEDDTDEEVENAFDTFIAAYFEDTDFEYLYDNAYDGIEETEVAQFMGLSPLAFRDWFSPFSDEPSRTPHPYVIEDDFPKKLRANALDRNKKNWTILDKNPTVLRSKSPLKQSLSYPKQALKGVRVSLSAERMKSIVFQ